MTNRFTLVVAIPSLFLMAPTQHAVACQFDTDCQPGSNCIKSVGQIYGICMGGSMPGNLYDSEPVYAPLDLNRSYGNTCQFDVDCGPGSKCAKSSGSINGHVSANIQDEKKMTEKPAVKSDEQFALGLLMDHLTSRGEVAFQCKLNANDPPDLIIT